RLRFTDDQRRRLAARAKRLGRRAPSQIATIVTPGALLALHPQLIAPKDDGSARPGPRRPRTEDGNQSLVVGKAVAKRGPGYTRIVGALLNLGHNLARGTVANILKRNGIEPAPERSRKTTWKEFLAQHWDMIVAADFFTIEVWTAKGLQRFLVLFFIELSSRRGGSGGGFRGGDRGWGGGACPGLSRLTGGGVAREARPLHNAAPPFTNEVLPPP